MLTDILTSVPGGRSLAELADGTIAVGHASGVTLILPDAPADEVDVGSAVVSLAEHPDGGALLAAVAGHGLVLIPLGSARRRMGPRLPRQPLRPLIAPALPRMLGMLVKLTSLAAIAVDAKRRLVYLASGGVRGGLSVYDLDTQAVTGLTRLAAPTDAAAQDDRVLVSTGVSAGDVVAVERTTALRTSWDVVPGPAGVTSLSLGGGRLVVATIDDVRAVGLDGSGDPDPGTSRTLADGLDTVWAVRASADGSVLIGTGSRLVRFTADDPPPAVAIDLGTGPLYLNSWRRVAVALDGSIPFDDLRFVVEPPAGGHVSTSQDASDDPAKPSALLLSSSIVGDYVLSAYDVTSGDPVAKAEFAVTDAWDEKDGPPLSFVGEINNAAPDPAWGGGDPYVPQNVDVHPVTGPRRLAAVIVETADCPALAVADVPALQQLVRDELFGGIVDGGVTESTDAYYRRISQNVHNLVDAGVVGPVRLPSNWTNYASSVGGSGDTSDMTNFARAAIAEVYRQNRDREANGDPPLVDLLTVDSVAVVVRSIVADPATGVVERFHWPYATRPGGYQLSFQVDAVEVPLFFGTIELPVFRTLQVFTMPEDWAARTSREFRETSAHEYGHNLGLPDEYSTSAHSAAIAARDPGSWTLMSWEDEFPQPTAVEKMWLGWIRPEWVRTLSFATVGPIDEDIVLHDTALGAPPAGRVSAVEVRKADGENVYFEFRRTRPTTLSDQSLPETEAVLGTNFISGDTAPAGRRNLLLLDDDSDADGGTFRLGDDYRETDNSDPQYPNDLVMSVDQVATDWARIHITYGDQKPDPQIRPWAASTNWKSPDIEVSNSRAVADPGTFRNVPWAGHPNTVTATVRNPGPIDAKGVSVEFYWKDYTFSEGAEHSLGTQVLDVPSNTPGVVFTAPQVWTPPVIPVLGSLGITVTGHFCVGARIAAYADPDIPNVREVTIDNNNAQSNYTFVITDTSSPSRRAATVIRARNPLPVRARVYPTLRQTHPGLRLYLDAAWRELDPGEQSDFTLLVETMVGEPTLVPLTGERGEKLSKREHGRINITGIAATNEGCHGEVIGGAHIVVVTGRRSRFTKFFAGDRLVTGRVETVDTGTGVSGPVVVTFRREGGDDELSVSGVVQGGDFRIPFSAIERAATVQLRRGIPGIEGRAALRAAIGRRRDVMRAAIKDGLVGWDAVGHYLGSAAVAPCDSEPHRIEG